MLRFKKHSGIYTMEVEQHLSIHINQAWEFFSSPHNLSKITPSNMGFEITSGNTERMYTGQIITYMIGLLPGIKSNWVTEITQVKEYEYFVDEQRFGPYKMWHHEHHFESNADGVLMTDKVSYKLPFGFIGDWLHPILIKPKLKKIFNYRYDFLRSQFD